MMISTAALRELHSIHRQLTDLRGRLQRGPLLVAASESNVTKTEAEHQQAKQQLVRTRVTADDKQLQLKQRENRIEELRAKLNVCNSNREYQALSERIAADDQANSVLQDEILEALEKMDVQQAQINQLDDQLILGRKELDKIRRRVAEDTQRLEGELAGVMDRLGQAEALLPEDFKREYQRISKARGEDTLAEVDGESCGSCYQLLSAQILNELLLSKPVFCKSCGALLYLNEQDEKPT